MKKKLIVLGLITAMTFSMFACGNDDKSDNNETKTVGATVDNGDNSSKEEKSTDENTDSADDTGDKKDELTDEFLLSQPETDISCFRYTERDDGTIQIDYYLGANDGNDIVVIPAQIEGKDVTKICKGAFTSANVKAVVTGKNVSIIAGESFFNIKAEKILINSPVKKLNEYAFMGAGANYITLPEGLEVIGAGAFSYAGMKEITIPSTVNEISGAAFNGAITEVVVIESNSVEIQSAAFGVMENLEKIYIPSGEIIFEEGVFYSTKNVTIITPSGSTAEAYAKDNGIPVENE